MRCGARLMKGVANKGVGNVGITFDYTNLFHSVRFYNVDTWATGSQLRSHICDLKI